MKIVGEGDVRRFNYAWGVLQGVNLQGSWSKSHQLLRSSRRKWFGRVGENSWKGRKYFGNWIDVYGLTLNWSPETPRLSWFYWIYGQKATFHGQGKLQKRLNNARLILGLVEDTVQKFIDSKPSPVAFIASIWTYIVLQSKHLNY